MRKPAPDQRNAGVPDQVQQPGEPEQAQVQDAASDTLASDTSASDTLASDTLDMGPEVIDMNDEDGASRRAAGGQRDRDGEAHQTGQHRHVDADDLDEFEDLFLSPDEDSEGMIDMPSEPEELAASLYETQANPAVAGADDSTSQDTESAASRAQIDELNQQVAELQEAVEQANSERDELRERWMRASADLDNLRKRTRREKEDFQKYGHDKFALELVQVVDNLERALAHAQKDKAADQTGIIDGVEMVYRQLVGALQKFGVVAIDARGQKFDPEHHEAIQQVETPDMETGSVVEQYQKGYAIHDRLLRPAMVSVAKKIVASDNEPLSEVNQPAGDGSESDDSGPEDHPG